MRQRRQGRDLSRVVDEIDTTMTIIVSITGLATETAILALERMASTESITKQEQRLAQATHASFVSEVAPEWKSLQAKIPGFIQQFRQLAESLIQAGQDDSTGH